jgi:hypothetical protein
MNGRHIARSAFLRSVMAGAAFLPGLSRAALAADKLRGDRVGWARLKTPNPWWKRHAEGDPFLMQFLREQTSLNLDPQWHQVDCEDLPAMSVFPLIFTQEVASIPTKARTNLAEYIGRGGFLIIDACVNPLNNPDPEVTFREQVRCLQEIWPAAKVTPLTAEHPVYRCHFQFPAGKPPHTARDNPVWTKHPLYSIQVDQRLAGIFSMSGLQCGWARQNQPMEHRHDCMKMLVNIYVYAMTQRG